jgi:hypothetical protein
MTDRPKNGTLISKMCPCRLIHLRIAPRRKKANATPCTSMGKRTAGGLSPIADDVAHSLAVAEGIMWFSKLMRPGISS